MNAWIFFYSDLNEFHVNLKREKECFLQKPRKCHDTNVINLHFLARIYTKKKLCRYMSTCTCIGSICDCGPFWATC